MKTVKSDNQPAVLEMATAMATATDTVTPTNNSTATGNIHDKNNARRIQGNIIPRSLPLSLLCLFFITIIVMEEATVPTFITRCWLLLLLLIQLWQHR